MSIGNEFHILGPWNNIENIHESTVHAVIIQLVGIVAYTLHAFFFLPRCFVFHLHTCTYLLFILTEMRNLYMIPCNTQLAFFSPLSLF